MPRLGSKNKKKLGETTTPVKDKVDFYREFSKVKNTVKATDIWIGLLEKFREEQLYIGKIQEVESEQDLIEQLCSFFANMKKKDGADHSVNSIRAYLAAINRFLQEKSRIKNIDIYNDSRFKAIKEVFDGKIRYLSKNGKGKADKLILANHPEVTPFLDKYLSLRPHDADSDFYLQEVEEEFALRTGIWKITNHSGRHALIQNCEKMGLLKEEIKLLLRHCSDAGLLSYTLLPDDKKDEIIGRFMDKIHGKSTLDNMKVLEILNGQDSYNEKVMGNENNNFKTTEEVFYENQQNSLKKPLQLTDINQQLEISMNIDQFKGLFNCGLISKLKGKGFLKSNDITNLSIKEIYDNNGNFVQNGQYEFLRSHDIQFTIGNDTFQEVVCHNERLGGNDEWCIELIKQNTWAFSS
ncbi:hypothetical protein RclHR1_13010008 [Rhizophagus clarus]|uniref:Uncharacterized protein n=1 Tax=Rhizophagus clarus TaxID=94130 RepID=A0A2Z6QDM5_9GLOM|nr:hypothetical protein RclHR1_13010008 [Rhizophagus clarus]